ncbi:hypothetical protein M407DRAFT_28000 [Tulasnella calospora MUT 4182]|uniref:Uncharacterized protein n=1 Tax=Tulasnella calospora MUT 4182 TaxID=1051891 RepID=A0A0C3QCX3_9AGAM|nr:hypothetical protein M407DRAFT_28000 [Tulasnella calospora MUT 4182]
MTRRLPYEETSVDFVIIRQIFESPLPKVDGQSRLSDCLQVWELMTRCWNGDPLQRPTARMCKTTVTCLPCCTPTPANTENQTRSAALLENLDDLESWKGNLEKSATYLNEALRLYQEEANIRGIAGVLWKQSAAAYRISDYGKVRATATAAFEHCRNLDDALGVAEASFYLGLSIAMLSSVDEGLQILQQSLEIRRTHGDDVGAVQCLERIGDIQRAGGQMHEALSTRGEAVVVASRSGDRLGRATALHAIGLTHSHMTDFVEAADALSEAIMITRKVGWEGGLTTTLQTMGCLKMLTGNDREAQELFFKSRFPLLGTLNTAGG